MAEGLDPSEGKEVLRALVGCPPDLLELRGCLLQTRTDLVHSASARALTEAAAVIEESRSVRREAVALRESARRLRDEHSVIAALRDAYEHEDLRRRDCDGTSERLPRRALAHTLALAARERLTDARARLRAGSRAGLRSEIVCVAQHAEAISDYASTNLDFEAIAYAYSLVREADRLAEELLTAEGLAPEAA